MGPIEYARSLREATLDLLPWEAWLYDAVAAFDPEVKVSTVAAVAHLHSCMCGACGQFVYFEPCSCISPGSGWMQILGLGKGEW